MLPDRATTLLLIFHPKTAEVIIPQHWTLHLSFLNCTWSYRPSWLAFFPVCKDPSAAWHMCCATSHSPPAWRPMFFHSGRYPIRQGDHPRRPSPPKASLSATQCDLLRKKDYVTGPKMWTSIVWCSKLVSLMMGAGDTQQGVVFTPWQLLCSQKGAGCPTRYQVTLRRIWAHVKMNPPQKRGKKSITFFWGAIASQTLRHSDTAGHRLQYYTQLLLALVT